VGYYRPVENFNVGKKQEHKDRMYFKEEIKSKGDN
jgi:anaerobic ribonucleoside-triphosphate reductase